MCVIFVVDQGVRPSEDMIRHGYFENKDGGGVAWREEVGGKLVVKARKSYVAPKGEPEADRTKTN